MNLRCVRYVFHAAALSVFALAIAAGQTPDTSGNGLLKGSYRFRHVAVRKIDSKYNPTEITAAYGAITFDGAGKYVIAGTSVDNTVMGGAPQSLSVTAAYAIGSSGLGFITNPLLPADANANIYGWVAQGVYVGSSTESQNDGNILNDIFITIPVSSSTTNASFTSSYQAALLDFTNAGSTSIKNALFELSPNGQGAFGAITLNGQAANQIDNATGEPLVLKQSITGATYNFNGDGSATLTIPLPSGVTSTNALFTGSRTIFVSADGNFILGWTATGYDIFFGVKALATAGTNSLGSGLYFTAALEDGPNVQGIDSYYGSTDNFGDASGDGVVHERVNMPSGNSYDYGVDDQINLKPDGTAGPDFNGYSYIFGDGGQAFVAIGTLGNFALQVGVHTPKFSGPGVYLFPTGVVNAASYQPVTASLAPGELITLFGSGLSSGTATAPVGSFPTNLGGVSVSIDGIPCPMFYVSPGQMAVIVPYEVSSNQTGLANIQVDNNGTLSNIVQMYLGDSAPGSFSQNLKGIGYAAALHADTNLPITAASPAQPGEYISLFLTGLGTVTPTITDGAPGPSSPLSWSDLYNAGDLSVYFNDYGPNGAASIAGMIQFAGLAPTLVGLYQVNVRVPVGILAAGDNVYLEFITDTADVNQIQIPYGSTSAGTSPAAARQLARASGARFTRLQGRKPSNRRLRGGFSATAAP